MRHRPSPHLGDLHDRRCAAHRIVSCLSNGTPYELRDVDGTPITSEQGRAIITDRYQIPAEVRDARRTISKIASATRKDERVKKGVAERSKTPLVPTPQ